MCKTVKGMNHSDLLLFRYRLHTYRRLVNNIGVRAGGLGGLQPPQILGNSDFWAAKEILAKPLLKEVSMFLFLKR